MERETVRPRVWTEDLKIRSYDVDATRRATSTSLCRYFLEAAWNHAEALGMGFGDLGKQGKFWVLSRLRVEVHSHPLWGSPARLSTWPRGTKSVFAMRDFELVDGRGARLVAGSSAWLVLDAASKRPQRLSRILPELDGLDGRAALGRDPEKLMEDGSMLEAFSIPVRYTDIDVNRHVNSARYIGWILDAYPASFHLDHGVRVLEVNYVGETREGEVLSIRGRQTGAATYYHVLVKADGEEVCRARLEWGPLRTSGGPDAPGLPSP